MALSSRSWYRGLAATSAAVVFAVAGGASALADNVVVDGDVVAPGLQDPTFGSVACGATVTLTVPVAIRHNGGVNSQQVFEGGTANPVTVAITDVSGAGLSASLVSTTVVLPAAWEESGNNTLSPTIDATLTLTSTVTGPGTGSVDFSASGTQNDGTSRITRTGSASVSWTTGSCAPTQTATTTTVSCPATAVYTGAALTPCTASVTGTGGFSQSLTVAHSANTNVGTAAASASFAGDATHLPSSGNATFAITKAESTTSVDCPETRTYTGAPQEPCTAGVTGAGGLNQPLTPDYVSNVDVGTAKASASYGGDANHLGSTGSDTFEITAADSVTTITCSDDPLTYTGDAHTPCSARATGTNLDVPVTVTYEDNVDAGTATASATFAGDANHAGSSASTQFEIGQATADCTVSDYSDVYDAAAHGASGSCTGVKGEDLSSGLDLGATFTDAGSHQVGWTFDGGTNYGDLSGSATVTITQADPTCTISGYDGDYTATAHGATGTCRGVVDEVLSGLDLGASFVHAPGGTAAWALPASLNYTAASGNAEIVIARVPATCSVLGYDGTYDADPHGASGTCTGIGGEAAGTLDLGATFTDVPGGTATWSFTGNSDYLDDAGTASVVIGKATSTVTVLCSSGLTYTGSPLTPCSATASGVGLTPVPLTVSYTDNTNSGTANASASWGGDANHKASSGSADFVIAKASSTVTLTCPAAVYFTGSDITPCTATVAGAGGLSQAVQVHYVDNKAVGTATATASYDGDANHEPSATQTAHFTISAWRIGGFYQPVDMNGVWNTVKGGSTVPLKFELFSGTTELSNTNAVKSFTVQGVACPGSSAVADDIELTTTGGTSLRYDTTGGQFIQNWQTPKSAGSCYRVTMTALDLSTVSALFKLK